MGILSSEKARRLLLPAAVLSASGLLLTGCGAPPEEGESNAGGESQVSTDPNVGSDNEDYLACIVSDEGGFDDRSFNQSSYEGLKAAEAEYGITIREAESQEPGDFTPNVNSMVEAGCDSIFGVGYMLGDTIKPIAEKESDIHFFGVDVTDTGFSDNVQNLTYDTAQAAFLAGYLAAGMSETGTVATYGGMEIPTVTIFMEGFAEGVEHYNQEKGEDVKVLGWDNEAKTGSFIGNFSNQAAGKTNTANFINEGADIIMPVAGPVGLGTLDAVEEAGEDKGVKVIWVDSDGYESTDKGQLILTSVMKNMGQSVTDVIAEDLKGEFTHEPYLGTLENQGVGLAPFHDLDGEVSDELKQEIDALKQDIIDGEVTVESSIDKG